MKLAIQQNIEFKSHEIPNASCLIVSPFELWRIPVEKFVSPGEVKREIAFG